MKNGKKYSKLPGAYPDITCVQKNNDLTTNKTEHTRNKY